MTRNRSATMRNGMRAAFAAAAVLGALAAPSASPVDPGLDALLAGAKRVQREDARAWQGFRFRRAARREKLDDEGNVVRAEEKEFEMTPVADGFEERLVRIDGREPTPGEVEDGLRDRPFTRHYRTFRSGQDEADEESGYSLATLLHLASYRDAGVEMVDGLRCRRLDFSPADPAPDGERTDSGAKGAGGGGIVGRIVQAMAGSLWITEDGSHLLRARAVSIRPVSIAFGLSKVHEVEVRFDGVPVEGGAVLPRHLEVTSWARVLFVNLHRRLVYTYSDYAPAVPAPAAGTGR